MKLLVLASLLAVASGYPQYNFQRPSGGLNISPGGIGRPSNRKAPGGSYPDSGGYDYNRPSGVQFGNGLTGGGGGFLGNEASFGGIGNSFGGSLGGTGTAFGGIGDYNQPAIIQKNVYVHIPPPELEEGPAAPAPLPVGAPEKNYKIIFIKAPAPKQSQLPVVPPPPLKEEKTLVYVLVKKPEEASQLVIPTPEPTQPSKPEVFFIRYKPVTEVVGPDGGYPQGTDSQAPGYQNGGQTGGPTSQIGGQGVQGYPSQHTGNQGANYLPPDSRKPVTGGSY